MAWTGWVYPDFTGRNCAGDHETPVQAICQCSGCGKAFCDSCQGPHEYMEEEKADEENKE